MLCDMYSTCTFKIDIGFNMMLCSNRFPEGRKIAVFIMSSFVFLYSNVRIFIVVVRTYRQISALTQSLSANGGNAGFVTVQAMRSSIFLNNYVCDISRS